MRSMYRLVATLAAAFAMATPAFAAPDWTQVGQALGKSGSVQAGGVYRVGFPRTDLQVSLDGVATEDRLRARRLGRVPADGRPGHGDGRPGADRRTRSSR